MIFFDIDGTLLDHKKSEYLGVKGFQEEYKEYFKYKDDEFYSIWCEISDKHFKRFLNGELSFEEQRNERIKDIFALVDIRLDNKEANSKFQIYLNLYEDNWKCYDDVLTCLEQLSNYRLGIITNGDLSQQSYKLEKIGVRDYFDTIIAAGDVRVSKPDKRIFEIACQKAQVSPKNTYYIGDELKTDILSCNKVNMTGIWINRLKKIADRKDINIIYSLEEIKGMIK